MVECRTLPWCSQRGGEALSTATLCILLWDCSSRLIRWLWDLENHVESSSHGDCPIIHEKWVIISGDGRKMLLFCGYFPISYSPTTIPAPFSMCDLLAIAACYGSNICVPPHPTPSPQEYIEILTPKVKVLGGRTTGR